MFAPRAELVVGKAAIAAVRPAWEALFAREAGAPQAFLSPAWLFCWADVYLADPEWPTFALLTLRDGDGLAAVLPLETVRAGGLSVLRAAGCPVSQYSDGLVARRLAGQPRAIAKAITWAAGELEADLIEFSRVREDGHLAPVLAALGSEIVETQSAPSISVPSRDLVAADRRGLLGGGRADKQRRKRRRQLTEVGEVKFVFEAPGIQAARHARAAIGQKRSQMTERGDLVGAVHDPRFEAFFAALATVTHEDGNGACVVGTLRCGDAVIAREIGVFAGDGYLAHVGVFDEAFARYGPGVMQIEETLAACAARSVRTYDLLAPADPYKRAIATQSTVVSDHIVPRTVLGRAYGVSVLKTLRPLAKRAKRELGPLVRQTRAFFAAC